VNIQFWGVRGSLPSPQRPSQIRDKIAEIVEQISPADIASPEARARFLAGLPAGLYGTVGGNSPCVSVNAGSFPGTIVFDAGSGLRELGAASFTADSRPPAYHIFFSHFHWDHIQGLPFFGPGYDPSINVEFYSPRENLEGILRGQMTPPYFPVFMDAMASKKAFHLLDGKPVRLGDTEISYKKMNHPGDSYSYKVREGEKVFIYATDTELTADDFIRERENISYYDGADVIVIDSQYTLGEAIEKYNWGHSAFSFAVDFAVNWSIKKLVLFHHDPTYDDRKLFDILKSARHYAERMGLDNLEILLAMEGMEISL
jgi:phosphoribosyl 1,2-cyclic phosphodiesterase